VPKFEEKAQRLFHRLREENPDLLEKMMFRTDKEVFIRDVKIDKLEFPVLDCSFKKAEGEPFFSSLQEIVREILRDRGSR